MQNIKMNVRLLLIVVLVNVLLIFFVFRFCNTKGTINSDNLNKTLMSMEFSLKDSYTTNGEKIPSVNLLDLQQKDIDLQTYLGKKKSVLLIYSEVSCNSCVDSLIANCNRLVNRNDKYQVLAVAYSRNIEYLRRFVRINSLKFPLFWDKDNLLFRRLEIRNLPVILLVSESGIIVNSFYITPQIQELNPFIMEASSKWLVK